jgi:hypothetical protein
MVVRFGFFDDFLREISKLSKASVSKWQIRSPLISASLVEVLANIEFGLGLPYGMQNAKVNTVSRVVGRMRL